MIIHSDWHMHCYASYDSTLSIKEIEENTRLFGFEKFGITDHVNFNDKKFLADLSESAKAVGELKERCERVVFGVELTPIEKPEFDYVAKHSTREGYVAPVSSKPYDIELAQTKEELMAVGVRYAIGAAHWRVDVPGGRALPDDMDASIKEWHRQQMWLVNDERVTILGHPWYHGKGLWYEDFSVIPRSINEELMAALKESGKYVECNSQFFNNPRATEKFRHQYAEFLREMFEMGIPMTYGSDSHNQYLPLHVNVEKYLVEAGFCDGDIVAPDESVFW